MVNETTEEQILFIENMTIYEPHEVNLCNILVYQNAFCYFFQASEEGKTDNDNDFKIS